MYLHAWNSCSLVLPILKYCCPNEFCSPSHSAIISLKDLYHSLATPISVRQNLCTSSFSQNICVSIQSFILGKWASASSSGFLENLGLNLMVAYVVQVVVALVVLLVQEGLEVLEGLEDHEDQRIWSSFCNRREWKTLWFSHCSSFVIIISFVLNLFDMCIL